MDKLSLATLLNGGAIELVDEEFEKIARNILDPNYKADGTRTVTLTISIKPNARRTSAEVDVKVSSKLGVVNPQETQFFFTQRNGVIETTEYSPEQTDLFESPQHVDEVITFKKAGKK